MASTGLLLLVSAELYKNLENHPDAVCLFLFIVGNNSLQSFTTNVVIYNKIEPLSDISPLELLIGDSVCTSTLYVWKNQDKLLKATIGDLINITYLDITEVCSRVCIIFLIITATYDSRSSTTFIRSPPSTN